MKLLFIAENLKFKHSISRKLVVLVPVGVMILTLFLCRPFYQNIAMNWWYGFGYAGLIAILSALSVQKDGGKRHFQNILTAPVPTNHLWIIKMGVTAFLSFVACMVMLVGVLLGAPFQTDAVPVPILPAFVAMGLIYLTTLWQVPLCFMITYRMGILGAVLINVILDATGILMAPAASGIWLFNPYSWAARVVCPILGIAPNGLLITSGSQLFDTWVILPSVGLSLVLTILLTVVASKVFGQKEAKEC